MDEQSSLQHMPIQYYGAVPCPPRHILQPFAHGTFQQPPSSPYANAPALTLSARLNQFMAYHHQKQQEEVEICWANQKQGFEQAINFRNHSLPLARIKKIMKSDEHVRMISAEAPVLFAKACEMFITELTLRAWNNTEETKRRILHKNDIAAAITRTDIFDFLIDILPRDVSKENQVITIGIPISSLSVGSSSYNAGVANSFHRYYSPNQHYAPHGVTVGEPMHSATYTQQPRSPVDYVQNLLQWGHMSRPRNSG